MHSAAALHTPPSLGPLTADWAWRRLDQVCEGVFDCPHSTPILTDGGPLLARSQDIRTGVFRLDSAARVSETTYRERIARVEPRPGDLLYSREGTYFGIAAEVPTGIRVCLGQRMVLLRPRPECVEPRYLLYWLNSPLLARHVGGFRDGSVAERLNLPTIRGLPVLLPPMTHQVAVAQTLGTLDDKSELNRQINETLEAMARAIFRSWFVDFDPVRAKTDGRDLGLPGPVADRFPDSFAASELGEIPRGWAAGCFGDMLSQRTERLSGREASVLSAVATGELVRSDELFTKRVYSKEINKYFAVEQWDIAYNPSRINIGSIGMLKEPLLGAVSPAYVVARPRAAYRWFLEFLLERASTRQWINTFASGSVRQSLSYVDFASIPCVVPPESITQHFDDLWSALRGGVQSRIEESRTLAALRDTLLPKMLSGEVQVKRVEKIRTAMTTAPP